MCRLDHRSGAGRRDKGGYVVFEGTPEELAGCKKSFTAEFLKGKLIKK